MSERNSTLFATQAIGYHAIRSDSSLNPSLRFRDNVGIDKDSIEEFIRIDKTLAELDAQISRYLGGDLHYADWFAEKHVLDLKVLEITTIADLREKLIAKSSLIAKFAEYWILTPMEWKGTHAHSQTAPHGVSLLYLEYVLAAEAEDLDETVRFLMLAFGTRDSEYLASFDSTLRHVYAMTIENLQ